MPGSTCTVKKIRADSGLAERQVVVDGRAVELLHEELLQALAQRGVESIARQGHHDRHAASVQVAAHEHADAAVLLELEQPDHEPTQLVGRGLEQLVLRERLEELRRFLVVMGTRDEVFGGEDLLELVVQQWRLWLPTPCTPST